LQDIYTDTERYAAILGASASGSKRVGLLDLRLGAESTVPLGPTGVGWAGVWGEIRAGEETGPYLSTGYDAGVQWTQGQAFNFVGAPTDGVIYRPRVAIGWQGKSWNAGLEWQRNRWGTMAGAGNLDGESVIFTIAFSGGKRAR
ncbi:MAG: hypothetical protein AAB426_10570, partial [Myxococcota bacterium]